MLTWMDLPVYIDNYGNKKTHTYPHQTKFTVDLCRETSPMNCHWCSGTIAPLLHRTMTNRNHISRLKIISTACTTSYRVCPFLQVLPDPCPFIYMNDSYLLVSSHPSSWRYSQPNSFSINAPTMNSHIYMCMDHVFYVLFYESKVRLAGWPP